MESQESIGGQDRKEQQQFKICPGLMSAAFSPVNLLSHKPLPHTLWPALNRRRKGRGKRLTSHRIGTGHEVQRDGVGRMGGHALQVALRDFVQAEGGGGHVFIHPVQERVHAWFLGLPQFQVPSGALAVFSASLHVLRIARQSSWKKERETLMQPFRVFLTLFTPNLLPASDFACSHCSESIICQCYAFNP